MKAECLLRTNQPGAGELVTEVRKRAFKANPSKAQQRILQAELDTVEENLEVLRQQGKNVSRAMLKGLEKRKHNLVAKLEKVEHAIKSRTDDVVDFKQMGIDHIFIDESHQFKNLTFNTRHDRVAGLGNSEGSQKALNMLFAIRTIQERTDKDLGLRSCPAQPFPTV